MRTIVELFWVLFFTLFSCGCSSQDVEKKLITSQPKARIEITGNGISIRRFAVIPNTDSVNDLLDMFGTVLNDATLQERLASEGLIVRIVDSVDIPAIAASVGEAQEERFDWHGQILKWRDVQQRQMPSDGMIVTAGGIPHLVDHGYLTLLARGWQMGMLQGNQLYLQLLPVWHVPPEQGVVPGRSNSPIESRVFSELLLECFLEDNQALLIAAQMEPQKSMTGPVDDGPPAVRLGEALMGGPVKDPLITFLVFEANVGGESDNW
ncbi:MAG: hypothetical protein QF444_00785 [Phycisphaerales bacterium]|jgi:hypothetical protein|nr:hypothetical protein [Phycisphaerales bacterium]